MAAERKTREPAAARGAATARPRERVAVIVINYRTPDLTIGCLQSLEPVARSQDLRVVVVDNASNDGSVEALRIWLETSSLRDVAELIASPTNEGFSGGNNLGIRAADADFYLLLNSDARLFPDTIDGLLAAAARAPEAGAVAPRLVGEDGSTQISCFRFMSPMGEFVGASGTGAVARRFARFQSSYPPPDDTAVCDWASFACILLRGAAIAEAGLMDEGFFLYFEDAEYCHRFAVHGWKTIYEPSVKAVHLRGGSSPVKSRFKTGARLPAYYYASRTRYYRLRYGPLGPTAANLCWLAGRGVARLRPLFGAETPRASARALTDSWINWANPLGDRRAAHEKDKA